MDIRDTVFDYLAELSDFTYENGLIRTSLRIEAALDALLDETGRKALPAPVEEARTRPVRVGARPRTMAWVQPVAVPGKARGPRLHERG